MLSSQRITVAMDKWRGKVAIVTGASSGIGAAIAASLVKEGVVVVGLARREDRVKTLSEELSKASAPGKLYFHKTDLGKEEDILAAFAWVDKELGGADLLVNNAGLMTPDYIIDGKTEDWRNMMEINFLAVAICSREYLKSMEKRNNKTGHIIIISSIAAHQTLYPKINIYGASKHAVKAFSMCLRKELIEKGSNIKVTTISPGLVATEIFTNTEFEETWKPYPMLESEDIAKVVTDILSASDISQICEVIMNPTPTVIAPY